MPDMQARQDGLAAYYFHQGTSERAYDYLGAHRQGAETVFRVWAPNADRVSLCGDFNGWDPAAHPMERVTAGGVWEIRVDSALIPEGMLYKYFLCNGEKQFYKADPYGFRMQCPPETASVFADIEGYAWRDAGWLRHRRRRFTREEVMHQPMNIYELHPGSWRLYPCGADAGERISL